MQGSGSLGLGSGGRWAPLLASKENRTTSGKQLGMSIGMEPVPAAQEALTLSAGICLKEEGSNLSKTHPKGSSANVCEKTPTIL